MSNKQIIQELKGLVNLYIAFENANRALNMLKTEHKNNPLSAQDLQQRSAAIWRELENALNGIKNNFADGSEQQQKVQFMNNSGNSHLRHTAKKIFAPEKSTQSPTSPNSSMRLTH